MVNDTLLIVNEEQRAKELAKYCAMFRRRTLRGQCFTQPYLGCREFACDWRLVGEGEVSPPIAQSRELGRMLYDMDFSDPKHPKPIFFDAKLIDGKLTIDSTVAT